MSDPQRLLAQALDALDRVQAQLESERAAAREPIAIVGLGCRFPGADDASAFADFLANRRDAVRELPAARAARFASHPHPALRRGGFFEEVAGFDAGFFGVSDEEALAMDPHQRMLLEVAWQALEDAGEAGGSLAGTNAGVWLGLGAQNSDYAWWQLEDAARLDRHAIPGSFHSLMAGRISYLLDLRGPSLVVDAACASGLAAVHLACNALRQRECDAALAGAVNLVLSPLVSAAVERNGLWSATGRCRAFDANADGFVRGEGCAVVLLKRLSDALASGDAIRAVIHGSAVGQDGRSNGLTAPNGPAQEAVMRQALRNARIDAKHVGYVEAHATGTRLGDAIEAEALANVYGTGRAAPLQVGALKPSLGHLEAASGIAALAKAIIALETGSIPATLHHAAATPDVSATGLSITSQATSWPHDAPYCGVSAFGMSGTNAHAILGPAPASKAPASTATLLREGAATLHLGAHDERALRGLCERIGHALRDDMSWPDVCASLNAGRRRFPLHVSIAADAIAAGREQLSRAARGELVPSAQAIAQKPAAPMRKVRLPTYPFHHRAFWPRETPSHEPAMLSEVRWIPARPCEIRAIDGARALFVTGDTAQVARVVPGLKAAGVAIAATLAESADVLHVCGPSSSRDALHGLLDTVRSLVRMEGTQRRLFVAGIGAADAAEPAMAVSLARTVALEHPDLPCRAIEVEASLPEPGAVIADEMACDNAQTWTRRGGAGRFVPRVNPMEIPHLPFQARAGACYVVTGAFGGIGREIVGWLVARGATDLLLLGRNPRELPEASAWRDRGVRIRNAAVDVADAQAVAAAIAPLTAQRVPLAGIFHAAGIRDDALLFQQDAARFEAVLRAKVDGARALREATRGQPLETFVLFSSVASMCGLVGAGAYVAANAALLALARAWRGQGVPALCVQWGTWEGSGMATASGARLGAHWEALGIVPFPAPAGIAALEALIASGRTEAIAARIDWPRLARWAASEGGGAAIYGEIAAPATPARAPSSHAEAPTARAGDLREVVRSAVAKVMALPEDHPDIDLPFGELGLGSLAAIELRSQLAARLGIPVPATLAFNHPSVDAVVRFLSRRRDPALRKDVAAT